MSTPAQFPMTPRFKLIVALVLGVLTHHAFSADAPGGDLTATQVIGRIQKQAGVPWRAPKVDTFKAGNPDAPVKGIAVTMMATFDVLRRAAASGATLIITHEPTFYGHQDMTGGLENENDQVLAAKQAFIKTHGLVIWRFHDHLHRMNPDMVTAGVINALGWGKFQVRADEPKLVARIDLHRDIEKTAPHFFGFAVEFKGRHHMAFRRTIVIK